MDKGEEEESIARTVAAIRVLEQASSIPLDQEGPVMFPPLTKWQILRQRVRCYFGRHAWGPVWFYRPLVPADFDVARMLDGAPWPQYATQDCVGCCTRRRKRVLP
jgi:hypothetical protein